MIKLSEIYTIERLKAYNQAQGYHFFDNDTMRFFKSKIYLPILHTDKGLVYVTSEKHGQGYPRLYTVRIMDETGNVKELNCDFQEFTTLKRARTHAQKQAYILNEKGA
jgi:hypothetical protein